MSKTTTFTTITPLPPIITREAVLATYHDHIAMIELNPLVVERFKCKPPAYATAEEFHAIWYTIKDKVAYLPGGLASGSVSYHACFHDLPDALQTHVYAPLGLDIKAKWSVGGSLPGEPKQPAELGLGIPKEGLYLREDVKMKCNIMMISFVKKTFKEAHSKLVDRLVEKTHLLEAKAVSEGLKAPSPHLPIAPGSPMFQPGSQGFQHMSPYTHSSASSSPMTSPKPDQPRLYQPPVLSPYGPADDARFQAQYANDVRYLQYSPHLERRNTYDEKPLPDPRYSQYSQHSERQSMHDEKPLPDPRYSLPPGQPGNQRISMHPTDQKANMHPADQRISMYPADQKSQAQTQFAPVELPTHNEPAEMAG